jgi:phosphomevalonate kinase
VTVVAGRAPGKLFVTGDWAVLRGAPAVVAAIDRHARVRVRVEPGLGELLVESLAEGVRSSIADPEGPRLGGDAGAVLAALRVSGARTPALAAAAIQVTVDSREFLVDGRKLGLGRSAATVTAAVAALLATEGVRDPEAVLEAAVSAHALFQEGRGSGADVAAAAHGGLIEFRRDGGRVSIAARALPPGVRLLVGWTGESSATEPLLAGFAAAAGREPPALRDLCRVAEQAAGAVARGDAPGLSAAVSASAELLDRLGIEVGIPIVTPALERLIAAARRAGAAAKPSGAGGGDCGIALAGSAAQAEAISAAWRAEGIVPLPLSIEPRGATAEVGGALGAEVSLG